MKQAPVRPDLPPDVVAAHRVFASGKYHLCLLPSGVARRYELALVYFQRVTGKYYLQGRSRWPHDVIARNWQSFFRYDDPDSNAVYNQLLHCPIPDTWELSQADILNLIEGASHGL